MPRFSFEFRDQVLFHFLYLADVNLVHNNDLRLLGQKGVVLPQFFVDSDEISDGIVSAPIYDMQQNLAPLDVSQECGSESSTARSPLDQTRNIAQDQTGTLVADIANSQIWNNGCERIIRNLGSGCRCRRQQGRFASVGFSQKSHVGDQSQFDRKPSLGTRFGTFGKFRCRVSIGFEGCVASSSATPSRHEHFFSVYLELARQFLGVQFANDRSRWHRHDDISPLLTVFALPKTVSSLSCSHVHSISQRCKRVDTLVAYQIHGSASSTAASVGPPHRLALFPSKGNATISTITTRDVDASGVKEFPFLIVLDGVRARAGLAACTAALCQLFLLCQNGFFSIAIKDIRKSRT
mmetsp:Transcript_28888/g.78256  ORF Transcript_28888/g.78256 Transcript_28888/m.78256 type:complete len:351 (+) Transcript_28888:3821-4873(+)